MRICDNFWPRPYSDPKCAGKKIFLWHKYQEGCLLFQNLKVWKGKRGPFIYIPRESTGNIYQYLSCQNLTFCGECGRSSTHMNWALERMGRNTLGCRYLTVSENLLTPVPIHRPFFKLGNPWVSLCTNKVDFPLFTPISMFLFVLMEQKVNTYFGKRQKETVTETLR